ncbi:4-hydroxy-tetrahydrodipicolinate synthase [Planktomarina temperata]|jgi:4-hydroxy-tetrahydrodipicolinate synthase|uniref:4-hydroxy-tetrahydrodipicolinate synthase n=1 Tax=Planktomarina sp. TaxID=2024851 RepID=UPI0023049DDD|nr:4-hydroxy-tetrahydrodipicolinate synthase [Planktomarina temperata]MDA9115437.1 4-hydroxy-tetrahydrodipicolinate synthase [Planktomarina temperata]MDA9911687.1 4-hydroxy-tetrahydrodipicolinate synthase [Planktomarina temperata]MDA9998223.1 4-hydroxy-tetrahydrodipicolinate synthase [Planktomarina temperata]MDB2574388.1 4-hydroxy-tetrahydrodipicolinate synthase [Planktomarina temperata]
MITGSLPALVTPFANGKVDIDALKKLVDWHIDQGSHGLVPVGTTGESPTLTHEEHDRVVEVVVAQAAGRVPVIAGAGSNNTAETVRLVKAAKEAGATATLVVTPYYNKPTQAGLKAHFLAAADCGMDIIIYNIPGRSAVDMSVETMGELAAHKHIIGVKDATGDLSRVPKQRLTCGEDFVQLSGEDATALGFNAHGGIGCISVTANMAPALCAQMQEATLAGDYETALKITDKLMPLHLATFQEPGLVSAKYGLSKLGLCTQEVRSPLVGLSDDAKSAMDAALRYAGLID